MQEKLHEAVKAKLTEQRRFVLWWDGQEKHPGNRGAGRGNIRPSQTADGPKAEDFGLDRDTIHRWRRRLKTLDKFAEALEAARERCVKVCEPQMRPMGRFRLGNYASNSRIAARSSASPSP